GGDAVPGRLACAAAVFGDRPILPLVLRQAFPAAVRVHLAPRHPAANEDRSRDEIRLAIHDADGIHLHCGGVDVAVSGARSGRLALVAWDFARRLFRPLPLFKDRQEPGRSHLSFRRMSVAAFILISVFTLAAALAAASLRKLIHASLCLVIAFLGLAAFYFLLGAEFVCLVQVFVC